MQGIFTVWELILLKECSSVINHRIDFCERFIIFCQSDHKDIEQRKRTHLSTQLKMWIPKKTMLVAGLEPARSCPREILSLLCLPIPPYQQDTCAAVSSQPYALTSHSTHMAWMGVDSNHRSNLQQIYSLSPLATREPIHVRTVQDAAMLRMAQHHQS